MYGSVWHGVRYTVCNVQAYLLGTFIGYKVPSSRMHLLIMWLLADSMTFLVAQASHLLPRLFRFPFIFESSMSSGQIESILLGPLIQEKACHIYNMYVCVDICVYVCPGRRAKGSLRSIHPMQLDGCIKLQDSNDAEMILDLPHRSIL